MIKRGAHHPSSPVIKLGIRHPRKKEREKDFDCPRIVETFYQGTLLQSNHVCIFSPAHRLLDLHGNWWCAFFWACCNSFGAKNLVYRLFRPCLPLANVVIFFIGQTGASLAPKNVWQVSV